MALRLNGQSTGYTELNAPANGDSVVLTMPGNDGDAGQYLQTSGDGTLSWQTVEGLPDAIDVNASAPADSLNIDGSGRLLVGTSTARTNFHGGGVAYQQQIEGTAYNTSAPAFICDSNTAGHGPHVTLARSRGTSVGSNTVVQSGDVIGVLNFQGNDGTNFVNCARILTEVDGTPGANDMPGRLVFSTTADGASSPTIRMQIHSTGYLEVQGVYDLTTSSGPNVYVHGNGYIQRSTSSIKYKTDVETLEDSYADALLECRPVWYRSTCSTDDPAYGYWGFIAEEVAEIDPRLVHWKTTKPVHQEDGKVEHVPCEPEPEGVQYDRFVPHLINLVKRQKEQLESQAATIAALDARLSALEGGAA